MPQPIQQVEKEFVWISDTEVIEVLEAQDISFVPIDRIFFVDKGAMVFSDEQLIKGFVWKGKPSYTAAIGCNDIQFQMYMCVSRSKYLVLACGVEGDQEGSYVSTDDKEYQFVPKKSSKTRPKPNV